MKKLNKNIIGNSYKSYIIIEHKYYLNIQSKIPIKIDKPINKN